MFKKFLMIFALFLTAAGAFAQNVTAVLKDAATGEPVAYATVSLTREGQAKPNKYVLSTDEGKVNLESVRKGEYTFKAELMGYKPYTRQITMDSKTIELGEINMELDSEVIDAASVSAAGNPIVIKKDTIEYNASSFKTNDNDMLADLLKKLPGIEVSDNGSITVNGQAVTKVTIDGKTFFLDDPELAANNIPAKLVNKLKVIQKKSDQAEFTGIDDGQEEQVIDLSVKPGMMNGIMGNVQAAAGHDIPSARNTNDDFRFQSNAFIGKFTQKTNISLILNANNANARGGRDRSGGMMGAMMGGMGGMMGFGGGSFGGGGITTSYMGGLNLASEFFDGRMELGGNYMYNNSNNVGMQDSYRRTHVGNIYDQIESSSSNSVRNNDGHNFGFRLEHEFSKNANIIFEPQITIGGGNYVQTSKSSTDYDGLGTGLTYKMNESEVNNTGDNRNMSASSNLVYRQRLGLPGRTMTATARLNFSNNDMTGINWNNTLNYKQDGELLNAVLVDQYFKQNQQSTSLTGRLTYTEPLGNHFYVEADYQYNYSKSVSGKDTFNKDADGRYLVQDFSYSNNIINENSRHDIGANLLFQMTTFRAQLGFTARPTHTFNSTSKYDKENDTYTPMTYTDDRWNFSPEAMVYAEMGNNSNGRLFYRGNSSQPSTQQLMPVPDNTDPMRISFGNPALTPYFSHNFNGQFRYNNRAKFTSFNINFNGGFTQNPITNALWYSTTGTQYSMPFNGKTTANAGFNAFFSIPIAKSNFSINNQFGGNWSNNWSYVGAKVDMSKYADPTTDYYEFMDAFLADHPNLAEASDFQINNTQNLSFNDRLRVTYRLDNLEVVLSGSTRMNKAWYTISSSNTLTWNNSVGMELDYDWEQTGLGVNGDLQYSWYRGYSVDQPSQMILNMEITKLIFKNRATLAIRGYDLLGQTRNLSVSDTQNYHSEVVNNTLGRYIVAAITWRFGSFGRRGRGFGGPGPGMGGGRPGGPGPGMGGGRPPMGGGRPGGR